MTDYGMLTVVLKDGKRVVIHEENSDRILASGELLDKMEDEGYFRGGLYWFDDAGQWTYRKTFQDPERYFLMDRWVLERVR